MAQDQVAPVSLKTETSFKRLPSFKSPRDLKLSQFANPLGEARTKKVFVPNLNVQRKKQNDDGGSGAASDEKRERGRREGERGRGRGKKQFIQSAGVFSEGLAPILKTRYNREVDRQDNSTGIPKPRLKLNEPLKTDHNEEALIMKELMRDDFLDDPHLQPDFDVSPIQLPLTKLEDLKIEPAKEETFEKETASIPAALNGVRIKSEPGTVEEGVSSVPSHVVEQRPVSVTDLRTPSTANLLAQSHDTNFIFFQIPNSIPRLKGPESSQISASKAKAPQPSHQKDSDTNEESEERCTLRSLPAGRIGTLQILKSGRARLLLGDVKLQIEPGTQVAFKQELVSVDVNRDDKSGNMVHLGNIITRMLVTPDWESLLSSS